MSMQHPMRGSIFFYRLQHIERRGPQLILGSVVVDGDSYVVLLHEFLNAGKDCGSRAAGDYHSNPGSLAVLKLAAHIVIVVFEEADGSGSVELNAGRGIVLQGFQLFLRIGREDGL